MKLKNLHVGAACAFALLLSASALRAADDTATATPTADDSKNAASAVHKKTLLEQIKEGGWVMIPIGACSVFTVYLIGDGIIRTGRKRAASPQHAQALKDLFRQGDYVGAYNYCKTNPSPLTNVLRVGISLLGEGKQVTEEGMMGELAKENGKMQTWISYLSVIGVCTPMIGLLGTVTGMIRAFATLGSSGIGDPSALAGAIGEVLIATASGLFIAIPAFGAYYFLRNRAGGAIHEIQDIINGLYRKMPYKSLAGVHIGDDELYAAIPNWLASGEAVATT
ncbi:MAG: MotA/TolQ/ExbB proton channel family protein [Chthoniobacteraceae bacterium]